MGLGPGETLLVKNMGSKPLTFKWNNRAYPIQPKKIAPIPFEAVCTQYGDPRSMPNEVRYIGDGEQSYFIPSRTSELKRLSINYGCYEEPDLIAEVAPPVQIRTYDREVVTPVFLDPEGKESLAPVVGAGNSGDIANQIHRLQQQILILTQRVGIEDDSQPKKDINVEESFDDVLGSLDEDTGEDQFASPVVSRVSNSPIEDNSEDDFETADDDIPTDLPPALAGFVKRAPKAEAKV